MGTVCLPRPPRHFEDCNAILVFVSMKVFYVNKTKCIPNFLQRQPVMEIGICIRIWENDSLKPQFLK